MLTFFFSIIVYFIFFWVQINLIFPIETYFNIYADIVSLLYLPHAVRILSFFVIGRFAFFPIFIAEFLCHVIFVNQILNDAITRPLLSCSSVLIIFTIFSIFKINLNIKYKNYFNWKIIILVGFLSSILNSTFNFVYHVNFKNISNDYDIIYSYIIGDTTGVFFGLLFMYFIIKIYSKLTIFLNNEKKR